MVLALLDVYDADDDAPQTYYIGTYESKAVAAAELKDIVGYAINDIRYYPADDDTVPKNIPHLTNIPF